MRWDIFKKWSKHYDSLQKREYFIEKANEEPFGQYKATKI